MFDLYLVRRHDSLTKIYCMYHWFYCRTKLFMSHVDTLFSSSQLNCSFTVIDPKLQYLTTWGWDSTIDRLPPKKLNIVGLNKVLCSLEFIMCTEERIWREQDVLQWKLCVLMQTGNVGWKSWAGRTGSFSLIRWKYGGLTAEERSFSNKVIGVFHMRHRKTSRQDP